MPIGRAVLHVGDAERQPKARMRLASLGLALLAVAGVIQGTAPAAEAATACDEVQRRGGWTSITQIPAWTEETKDVVTGETSRTYEDQMGEWAVHPRNPDEIYVTAQTDAWANLVDETSFRGSLLRTSDGGCTWKEVLTLEDLNPDASTPREQSNVIDEVAVAADGAVYVAEVETGLKGSLGAVWVSKDGGHSWRRTTDGLPVGYDPTRPMIRGPVEFVPAPGDPNVVYLQSGAVVSPDGWGARDLYATTDAGASWEARDVWDDSWGAWVNGDWYVDDCVFLSTYEVGPCSDDGLSGEYVPPCYRQFAGFHGLVVDPTDASDLWGWRCLETEAERNESQRERDENGYPPPLSPRLVHSSDGGKTWTHVPVRGHEPLHPHMQFLFASRRPGEPLHLFIGADPEFVDVPEDRCGSSNQSCSQRHARFSILHSDDGGATWETFARVEVADDGGNYRDNRVYPDSFFPPFLGFGSSHQDAVLAHHRAPNNGSSWNAMPENPFTFARYERRSGLWTTDAYPRYLHVGDYTPWVDVLNAQMVSRAGRTYFVAAAISGGYDDTPMRSSIEIYQLPRR